MIGRVGRAVTAQLDNTGYRNGWNAKALQKSIRNCCAKIVAISRVAKAGFAMLSRTRAAVAKIYRGLFAMGLDIGTRKQSAKNAEQSADLERG